MSGHRKQRCHPIPLACAIALAGILAGCASVASRPITIAATPPDALQINSAPLFAHPGAAVTFENDLEREDYVLFHRNGRRMELLYTHATADLTALRYARFQVKERAETWNFNHGRATAWGPDRFVRTALADFIYRTYRLGREGKRTCIAFESAWNIATDDARLQPRRILFGYYCAPPEQPLTPSQVAQVLGNIKIRDNAGSIYVPPAARVTTRAANIVQKDAIDTARGAGTPSLSGNRGFPFLFARRYTPGNAPGGRGAIRVGAPGR